jgi:hypothetical protein
MTDETTPDTKEHAPPQEFLAFLATTNKGRSATELTDALQIEVFDSIVASLAQNLAVEQVYAGTAPSAVR